MDKLHPIEENYQEEESEELKSSEDIDSSPRWSEIALDSKPQSHEYPIYKDQVQIDPSFQSAID